MGRPRSTVPAGIAAIVIVVAAVAGCSSGDGLDTGQQIEASRIIEQRAAIAMIDLNEEDLSCAVDRLTVEDLGQLQRDLPDLIPAAEAVVSCVGPELIGASVLRSQAESVASASLECAVAEIDRRFVIELVAGAMAEEPPQVRTEIEVARALGVCLELDELLGL